MSHSIANRIDLLNIGLIGAAFAIAVFLPFELFLFSYAVLGPLHYLTEINWLNKRNFFVRSSKRWIGVFASTAALVCLYPILDAMPFDIGFELSYLTWNVHSYTGPLLVAGFLFSVALIFIERPLFLFIAGIGSIALSLSMLRLIPYQAMLAGFFLPTLIHVYLFTLLFIIYGAIRNSSRAAGWSAALLLFAPAVLLFIDAPAGRYDMPDFVRESLMGSGLLEINAQVAALFTGIEPDDADTFTGIGVKIQMFIAFAYTYHYLNWFSKTSVIGWKQALSRNSTIFIAIFWIALVLIYIYDFKSGFAALLFLSLLHVMLEFPLNVVTVREIFYKLLHYK